MIYFLASLIGLAGSERRRKPALLDGTMGNIGLALAGSDVRQERFDEAPFIPLYFVEPQSAMTYQKAIWSK